MAQKQRLHSLPQPLVLFAGVAFFVWSADACLKAQTRSVTLRRGQVLELQLLESIDSNTAHPGDKVPLLLTRDLVADGVTVLPKGSILYGRITAAHPAGNNCHDGRVQWKLEPIALASGQRIKTQFTFGDRAPDGTIRDRVSLPSTGDKIKSGIKKTSETALLVPVVVAFSPLMVPMGILMTEPCKGRHGEEEVVPKDILVAVSKTIKITQ